MDPLATDHADIQTKKPPSLSQDKVASMHEDQAQRTPSDADAAVLYAQREPYCQPGLKGILGSRYVALCAAFSAMGGLLFGYDQGVS